MNQESKSEGVSMPTREATEKITGPRCAICGHFQNEHSDGSGPCDMDDVIGPHGCSCSQFAAPPSPTTRLCPRCSKPQFWNPNLQEWNHSTGSHAYDCKQLAPEGQRADTRCPQCGNDRDNPREDSIERMLVCGSLFHNPKPEPLPNTPQEPDTDVAMTPQELANAFTANFQPAPLEAEYRSDYQFFDDKAAPNTPQEERIEVARKIHAHYMRHFLGKEYDPREDYKSIHIDCILELLAVPKVVDAKVCANCGEPAKRYDKGDYHLDGSSICIKNGGESYCKVVDSKEEQEICGKVCEWCGVHLKARPEDLVATPKVEEQDGEQDLPAPDVTPPCPTCNAPIFVRANGDIVAHYNGAGDRCSANETRYREAKAKSVDSLSPKEPTGDDKHYRESQPPSTEKIVAMASCDTSSALSANVPEITMGDVGNLARAYRYAIRKIECLEVLVEARGQTIEQERKRVEVAEVLLAKGSPSEGTGQ